jgi:hypothetical protein
VFTQPWPAGATDNRRDQVFYYQYSHDQGRRTLLGIDEQVRAGRHQGLRHQHRQPTPELVIEAYRRLFQIEKSFRMAKSDLAVRPIYHCTRDSIEAH